MQTKGIINDNYKPLVTRSSDSANFSIIQDDVCITPQVDCDVISAKTNNQPKVLKNVVVIGDSIIKNVNGRDVSRGDSVKIRPHPGASTEDLFDHIKPVIRKSPDIVVIHTGTNDLQNNCNIVKKAKKLVSAVKEVDTTP